MLRRITNPGLITVSIRGTDGAGHPAGLDLTLGTLDSGPLPSGGTCDGIFCPYPWSTIVVPAYVLLPGVQYAIVVRAPAGNALNCLCYGVDETAPTYAGGRLEHSGDSGITWGSLATVDWMFEEWGDPALPVVQTDPATEIT